MESNSENAEECSIKIDTIWSEADESLLIKEEIVSDVETECVACPQDNTNDSTQQTDPLMDDESSCNGYLDDSVLPNWQQPLRKKLKIKPSKNDESEGVVNHKLSCMHDTKNFKIVKRRLRCGDCRSLVCPECCKVMIPNLQSHFLGSGVCSSGTYLCTLCCIIFRSLCALQAHIRIHTMDTPYVCPDCGLIYNNIYFLILHLLNKCYHVYKIVRYKCKLCPGAYFTPETFVQHIQEKHIHCVFRCLYCCSLFSNYDEFNYHMETLHQKQKVQYLNYFRCSLCSNMVIPRFMYQRHVAQHRENSEFYEVDYQCLCGETYSLIGAFRSHFNYCNKKGILPPKWSFLQKKLRTHDVIVENIQTNEIVIQPLNAYSKNNVSLVKSNNKVPVSEEDKAGNAENPGKSNCAAMSETDGKELYKSENSNGESSTSSDSLKNSNDSVSNQGEKSTQESTDNEVLIVHEKTNVQLSESTKNTQNDSADAEKRTEEQSASTTNTESETANGDISKIYNHIPCDHLGYLIKKQGPEHSKTSNQGDDIVVEKCCSPKSYKIVTELDERTGIITTKTVPFDEVEIDEEDENVNEDDCDTESLNVGAAAKQYSNDKSKFKMGNTLRCPFCVVLFPKHNLTFQQFRLHLESYHPDAALNITVPTENEPGLDKPENKIHECGDPKNDDENSQSSNFGCDRETNAKEAQNESENTISLVSQPKVNEGISLLSQSETGKENPERECIKEKEVIENVSEETSNDKGDSLESEDCRIETVITHNNANSDVDKPEKENDKIDEVNEEKCDFDPLIESTEVSKDSTPETEKQNDELGSKTLPKSLSDLDYEGETSKDSSWSEVSGKDSKSVSPVESKVGEKERSRRESEVWSEFYESLKLAEKLKKRKKQSLDSDGKKKSVVTDYSSKRVVKKPKRYRESSESGDSNEMSNSEDEFLLENDIMDKIYTEEKGDAEEQLNKKQLLVNKLETVDGKFVDYLFDLVAKKEKLFELYKKHSTLRANRHSHDLRNYRRKVLNGIKQRGRPIKLIRYHELLKKKELIGERSLREGYQTRKKTDCSPESKGSEKKRGRPRKQFDPAKLKERRRSDREVDFIEKNFERDDEMSPSKRKRKLSTKLQYYRKLSDEKEDFSSGQVITNKPSDSNKKFNCAVCKEVFPELNEFREHIITHRMEENTYQCMECGECFVVRPSLEKHLHAFHKIKNTDKYITENDCCNVKKEITEEDNEPLKENQCKVCRDQFERPIDLTKHFRIHGMAFLKEFKKEAKPSEKRNP